MAVSAPLKAAQPPEWAFPVPVEGEPSPDDGLPRHVPGSAIGLTLRQIDVAPNGFPDWFPDQHPKMPLVVAQGRKPDVWACAYCHLPNGAGRPENASLAGLAPTYIRQQVANFRNGARPGSEPRRGPQTLMISISKAVTDKEVDEAAAYFSSLAPGAFVKVVESAEAPLSHVDGSMMAKVDGAAFEPIGDRIVEVPEDAERAHLRDPNTPYIAYVPPGSLKRGADLVLTGGAGRTLACATCHGPKQTGMGDIPRIAGRSPSYVMRQLYDIREGKRTGSATLMTVVVARLSDRDMADVAAYLATLPP